MKASLRAIPAVVLAALIISAPSAQAKASGPVSSMNKPAGCASLTYAWSGYRKAASAEFELRHEGIFQDRAGTAPVASAGSFVIPTALSAQFLAGEHYTVMALLRDGAGRPIQNSPAVWFGYC